MKKGLFWVVDYKLITKSVKCNWGKLSKEITKGKEYNSFPRGRVEINKGRIAIFLNPDINNEVVINKVIQEFELQNIDNNRIVADGSRHYVYNLF